ncbi:MAG: hypothetical protein AAB690_00900 [Patescibacteria group bacterium]
MTNQSKVLKWSVIIGIIVVLNLFFNYTLSLIYPAPEYEDFCPQSQIVTVPNTQDECVSKGGQWTDNAYYGKPRMVGEEMPAGYCDLQYSCRQAFEDATGPYNKNVFIVLVVLGALAVLVGNLLKGNEVISNGLALGGVLSFIIASMRYWSSADDLFRVIILAIALGLLIWIAWKKFSEQ